MAKAKQKTAGDIFEKWRALQGIETKMEFAHEVLGMSRQQYNNILNGAYVSAKELAELAVDHAGQWISEMAVEVMEFQGDTVPCICLEYIGDNGPCPRHGDGKKFIEFLKGCDLDDLQAVLPHFTDEQKQTLSKFISERNQKQMEEAKAQIRAEVAA